MLIQIAPSNTYFSNNFFKFIEIKAAATNLFPKIESLKTCRFLYCV